jgi:uncharacterized protein (DUF427 family)
MQNNVYLKSVQIKRTDFCQLEDSWAEKHRVAEPIPHFHVNQVQQKQAPMKAIWNGQVIAESNDTIVIENNHYFPANTIKSEFFKESNTHTVCPWKGTASYYTLEVAGEQNKDAAWYYPKASELARNIEGYVAFWKGVKVEK